MRDRLIDLIKDHSNVGWLIPQDLDLNKNDQQEIREAFIPLFLNRVARYEECNQPYKKYVILINMAVKLALKQMEEYEEFILQIMDTAREYELDELNAKKLKDTYDSCVVAYRARRLDDDTLLMLAENATKIALILFNGLQSEPPLIKLINPSIEEKLKCMMEHAILYAFYQRSSYLLEMSAPFALEKPDNKKLKSIIEFVIKSAYHAYHKEKWKAFLHSISQVMMDHNLQFDKEDAQWTKFVMNMRITAVNYLKMGDIYAEDDTAALQRYYEALRIFLYFEPRSLSVAICYSAIANVYNSPGQFRDIQKALTFYKIAIGVCKNLAIDENNKDEIYDYRLLNTCQVGIIYYELGAAYDSDLSVMPFNANKGQVNIDIKNHNRDLDEIDRDYALRMKSKANYYQSTALEMCKYAYGRHSLRTGKCNADIGSLYLSIKQTDIAIKYFTEALRLYKILDDTLNIFLIEEKLKALAPQPDHKKASPSSILQHEEGRHDEVKSQPVDSCLSKNSMRKREIEEHDEYEEKQSTMLFDNSHAFFFFKNQARISVRDTDSLKAKDVPSPQPVKPSKPHLWLSASIFKFLSELNKPVIKNSKVAEPVFSNSHKV